MEKNKLATREQLKKYFEKNKYPTQSQFAELIDAFKHREDIPTNKEAVIMINGLTSYNNGFLSYNEKSLADGKYSLIIKSKNEEDQIITISGNSNGTYDERIQYFFGSAPYLISINKIELEDLKENEYYYFYYQISQNILVQKLFGNNLPKVSDGFELGTLEGRRFSFQLQKQNFGQKINIVKTNIKFVNKTNISIQYRLDSGFWSSIYTDKDIITDHYDLWDYLSPYYKANLIGVEQSIECRLYNDDTNELLITGYLYQGQDNNGNWGGGSVYGIRNIRIECSYQDNQNNQINFK
ncbi:hypothetical protein [Chryseobacterium sp. EO14]|uniref:hypothetical protein n=1 Tax=Chryseobacterium sp. EO14 TaxID=2950551 RepID=UPI00210B221A|nr:hypothetical protein [Chryseobacterium sp. EO14]MCQ4139118.1 hypothetical protein [Chryseobacterium sp. EO14]